MATHDLELVRRPTTARSRCARQRVYDSADATREEAEASHELPDARGAELLPAGAAALRAVHHHDRVLALHVGLFGLVAINLREALRGLEERVEIVAFVLRGTPAETITLASQDIAAFPEVQDVAYVTEEQALARARRSWWSSATRTATCRSIRCPRRSRCGSRGLSRRGAPSSEWRSGSGDSASSTTSASAGSGCRSSITFGTSRASSGLVIGLAFAAVAVVIIGVTIRLTLLQRAREISIMRLVGATNWFIRGPFLLEGALKGLLGGLLSLVLCYAGYLLFRDQSGGTFAGLIFFHPVQMLGIVLFGVLLGLGGSMVSVGRHLRHV